MLILIFGMGIVAEAVSSCCTTQPLQSGATQIIPTLENKYRFSSILSFTLSEISYTYSFAEDDPVQYQETLDQGIEIPDLISSKDLWTLNWNNSFNYAINPDTQLRVSLPLFLQSERFSFTEKGTQMEYIPPEGSEEFLQQNSSLFFIGDAEIAGQYFYFLPNLVIGAELGTKLPTSKIKFNEASFLENQQGLTTGIFIPISKLFLFSRAPKRGWIGSLGTEFPFYENAEGYRTGYRFNSNVGYWMRWKEDYVSMLQATGMYQTGDQLNGLAVSQTDRSQLGLSLMQTGSLNDDLEWIVSIQQPVWIKVWEDYQKRESKMTIFSFGLTWL